jgi:predicted CxxxxCH...CXXCH cytochrome family protein
MDHANGVAEVSFGTLATKDGAPARWDRAAGTCSSTYCHGQFAGGALTNAPSWTIVDGSQAACGTCHGVPPPSPHAASPSCGSCHEDYTATTVNRALHANGTVDVLPLTCASCHGDPGRAGSVHVKAAPPVGTHGETATSARAVGAHQQHVLGSALSRPFGCAECHLVPSSTTHADGIAAVTWSAEALARADGAGPVWNGTTCAATYCHGTTLGAGGSVTAPVVWTQVDGTQAACGACHGAPPPAPHPGSPSCGRCHAGYGAGTVNLDTHVNGAIEVLPLACTSCHGDPSRPGDDTLKAAPPAGSRNETETTQRAVGAHQVHLLGSRWSTGFACTECHTVPTVTGHEDGVVELTWGPRARTAGAAPSWNGATCATTYCHGATLRTPGTNKAPSWTGGATQAACGTCHQAPPATSFHQMHVRITCAYCHGAGYSRTTVSPALHVDGVIQAPACAQCHGDE